MHLVKILMSLLIMEGSHGGCACWPHSENWKGCKQRVAKGSTIELWQEYSTLTSIGL
jgi:hypothetical protein